MTRICHKDYVQFVEEQGHECPDDTWIEAFMNNATCLLPEGHEGEHEWTPDEELALGFEQEDIFGYLLKSLEELRKLRDKAE